MDTNECGETIGDHFYKQEFRKVLQAHSRALDGPWRPGGEECSSRQRFVCEQAITPVDIIRVHALTHGFDWMDYHYYSPIDMILNDQVDMSSKGPNGGERCKFLLASQVS